MLFTLIKQRNVYIMSFLLFLIRVLMKQENTLLIVLKHNFGKHKYVLFLYTNIGDYNER